MTDSTESVIFYFAFFTRAVMRDFLRDAVLSLITPRLAALSIAL